MLAIEIQKKMETHGTLLVYWRFFTVDHPEYPDGPGADWLQLLQDRQA